MDNYKALSTVIAKVSPSSTAASAYTPTNTPASCPPVSDTWAVNSDALPPTPDSDLCTCMYNAASCVPSAGLSTKSYDEIFSYICGLKGNLCAGISADTETGVYGIYGMCNSTQKLAHVLNAYYLSVGEVSACDFNGQAVTQKSETPSSCSSGLASASSANAVAATATAPSDSSSSSNNDSFGVASAQLTRLFAIGDLAIGAYAGVALAAVFGMIML